MTAEKILQSDMLDILFEGRNKLYGAYELRRTYPWRVKQGIGGMVLAIALLAGGYYLSFGRQNSIAGQIEVNDTIILTMAAPPETPLKPVLPPPPPPPAEVQPPQATLAVTTPLIVPDLKETEMPAQADIDTSAIGIKNTSGVATTGKIALEPSVGTPGGDGPPTEILATPTSTIPPGPVDMGLVDQLPEYPGGRLALVRYMVNFLSSELEPGQKFVVKAQFVINQEGQVSDVSIVNSDDASLNEQVLKAIRKMKAWKPGILHGQKVAVRFTMPVTFVGPDE